MNYDFSILNDKDFEDLTRDLLSKKLQLYFQSFKTGKDKGIDLRYSTIENENKIIIQVKHFSGSKFSNLISVLKNEELKKISKINPERYIVVTSLPLNPIEKEKIKGVLSPYILSTSDIYSKENINSLIGEFPEIEEKYYKLWLTSTTVLNRILKNGIKGRSEFVKTEIIEKIRVFVTNKEYEKAINILNLKHFILITGAAGIGKTMLANMLTYQLLARKFELVYVTDIKEADDAYEQEKKQVFYFDDFLGSITLDLKSSRNVDALIVNFIERVKKDKHKRLILTCRTTILNQAKESSEKLDNSKIDIDNYEVKIEDYGILDKAKILYNHIYFSKLTYELKKIFFENEFYWKVIKHRNYNPRIIEFFTDIDRIEPEISYDKLILNFLEFPEKIWKFSFEKQISETSRIFLSTMFSLSGYYVVSEAKLKEVFDNRINYEIRNNNFCKSSNLFNSTIKELQNAFIKHTLKIHGQNYKTSEFSFFNPSLEDFLIYYFNEINLDEYFNVLKASTYIEQFKNRISTKNGDSKKVLFLDNNSKKLFNLFIERIPELKSYTNVKEFDIIVCLLRLFPWNDIKEIVIKTFSECDFKYLDYRDKDNLIEILEYFAYKNIIELIPIEIEYLLVKLTEDASYYFLYYKLPEFFKLYQDKINNMQKNKLQLFRDYRNNLIKSWEENIEKHITNSSDINEIDNEEELREYVKNKIKEIKVNTKNLGISNFITLKKYQFDFDNQLEDNLEIAKQKNIELENVLTPNSKVNETMEVNRLFNNEELDVW